MPSQAAPQAQPSPAPQFQVPHRTLITICAMAATLMQALDSTIANVALPYMQGSLSASSDQITWVLTSYITAAAIMTAPVGWLSARFGQKTLFLVSLVGFTATSMLCGIAGSLGEMVMFRLLQGLFGAALVPLSQATMLEIYPPEQRGSAMAIWGMGVMIGPILGPTLGGYLTEYYNWRFVFYVNLPFGVLATVGLAAFLPRTAPRSGMRFDWTGFALFAIGIAGLQLMLDRGETQDWFGSTEVIIEATMAGLGLYLFVVHLLTSSQPFINPRIFKDRNLTVSLVVIFAVGLVLLAVSALLAPWLQDLGNYQVDAAGLAMAPRGFGTVAAMMIAGRLANRVDGRLLMGIGVAILAWSLWDMTTWTPAEAKFGGGDQRHHPGLRLRLRVPAAAGDRLRHAGTGAAHRWHRAAAPAAQHRHGDRRVGDRGAADPEHPGGAFGAGRLRHAAEQGAGWGEPAHTLSPTSPFGAQAIDAMVNRQAQIIAYNDDFKLMMLTTLPMLLLLPLLRRSSGPSEGHTAVME